MRARFAPVKSAAMTLPAVAAIAGLAVVSSAAAAGTSDGLLQNSQPHMASQNTFFTDADVTPYGVQADVVSISGGFFLAHKDDSLGDFLAATQADVEQRLGTYKALHPEVDPNTAGIIVMDIEGPFHPKDLHTYSESNQDAIVDAFQVRIAAARNVFPNAELAIWGTLVPDPQGREDNAVYLARLAALIEAGEEGLYDDLDYLTPVVYLRFGCDDEINGPCDPRWDTIDEFTQMAVDGSSQLKKSNGASVPLLPFFAFKIFNSNSLFSGELIANLGVPDPLQATIGMQIDILANNGVTDVGFWSGPNSNVIGDPGDPTVTDYFEELFPPD